MLPRESTIKQLKKIRKTTKGKDIGDLTVNDRLNKNLPNIQYIGNPVDKHITSWEEFSKKDSKLQTIAFKSKLVNKKIKENNINDMEKNLNNLIKLEDFDKNSKVDETKKDEKQPYIKEGPEKGNQKLHIRSERPNAKPAPQKPKNKVDTIKEFFSFDDEKQDLIDIIIDNSNFDRDELELKNLDELQNILDSLELENVDELSSDDNIIQTPINEIENESIIKFESFSVKSAPKEEKQPDYELLGKEKEPKSNPNFGIGAVKAQEIKKITDFNIIDPKTPKERTIGGNAGAYIDNGKIRGNINRIEGKNVYIEDFDNPMKIKKFNIKDVVKTKKEDNE